MRKHETILRCHFVDRIPRGGSSLTSRFDGSKVLICGPVEAIDCAPGEMCRKGAPAFIPIDIAKMAISAKRTAQIASIERSEQQILLQGTELGSAWTSALDQDSGQISGSLVNREEVFVIFGSCTPL